ncbi:MAG: hypothetical protein GKR95_04710 [Gammaproteobacteria bacterium]|nr:hypothetical protein [Gammaproteobacteria bacterium]
MNKKPPVSHEDTLLFQEAVSGTRKLSPVDRAPTKTTSPGIERRVRTPHLESVSTAKEAVGFIAVDETNEDNSNIVFARMQLSRKALKRFQKGHYRYQSVLDMHGLRERDVAPALETFLSEAIEYNYQCILVIYGKGFHSTDRKGVIRPAAISWMKTHPDIIAFCSAQPQDGGTGAAYILLRE